MTKCERWIFEVVQGGMVVASGEATDRDTALHDAGHYVMMYGQDGEAKAIVRRPGDKRALVAKRRLIRGECVPNGEKNG